MELITLGYILGLVILIQLVVVVATAGVVKSCWDTINEDYETELDSGEN